MLTAKTLSESARSLQLEARELAASVPGQLLLDMDADRVRFPREFLLEAGRRTLLGLRFEPRFGGRGLPWTAEMVALEEIGVLGTSLPCLWSLVSIVGEAIATFGTEEQKERFLVPMLRGTLAAAEALTEPRGGSDFFAATTTANRHDDKRHRYHQRDPTRFHSQRFHRPLLTRISTRRLPRGCAGARGHPSGTKRRRPGRPCGETRLW